MEEIKKQKKEGWMISYSHLNGVRIEQEVREGRERKECIGDQIESMSQEEKMWVRALLV
jgi:hypothetical protein